MCGIASIFLYPQERSPQVWEGIRENFTANLLFNEKRGEAATGLAIVNSDGTVILHKQAFPAHKFVRTETYKSVLESLNANTVLILGHTRLPTQGSPEDNRNNHPIQTGPVCGIHNGQITNDDTLFTHWGFTREAEVDSEIIFRLIADCGAQSESEIQLLSLLQDRLRTLQGRFTFLASDCRIPQRLLVVKYNNPISLHFSSEWNSLIFSSSYIFLRKSFGRIVVTESLANHHLALFDVEHLQELKSTPWRSLAI